ncbi:hypothetical protein GGF46_002958 [Coemansia sp. RSA 552]|nr:hypothetical protein GGF46_002958 [Coemansia sp. RSA 552]
MPNIDDVASGPLPVFADRALFIFTLVMFIVSAWVSIVAFIYGLVVVYLRRSVWRSTIVRVVIVAQLLNGLRLIIRIIGTFVNVNADFGCRALLYLNSMLSILPVNLCIYCVLYLQLVVVHKMSPKRQWPRVALLTLASILAMVPTSVVLFIPARAIGRQTFCHLHRISTRREYVFHICTVAVWEYLPGFIGVIGVTIIGVHIIRTRRETRRVLEASAQYYGPSQSVLQPGGPGMLYRTLVNIIWFPITPILSLWLSVILVSVAYYRKRTYIWLEYLNIVLLALQSALLAIALILNPTVREAVNAYARQRRKSRQEKPGARPFEPGQVPSGALVLPPGRQTDSIIRKKAEADLNKKMGQNRQRGAGDSGAQGTAAAAAGSGGRKRAPAGTVAALRPAAALTVRDGISITEASQLMAAKRADSVLVVDDDERLAGIFTAKDVAFRVVAEGLDARTTHVRDIATRDPLCVTSDTEATDALNLMVGRGFRHLPVCNEEGDVVGLLDIIRCMYEALEKMERAHQSSKALYAAIEGVGKEWSVHSEQMMSFVSTLRERMSFPDMTTVLDGADPVIVGPKTPVMEIARLMRAARVTASLVVDDDTGAIAGIFTSKDIVLRVIAAGLDPRTCSVVRVMTPHPDTVDPSTSLIDALKRMYERHYLNLPIVDEAGEVLGLVDVLRLCYATLEQMKSIQGSGAEDAAAPGGPMWSHFFSGTLPPELGGPGSGVSDPSARRDQSDAHSHVAPSFVDATGRLASEIFPNESASMIEDIHSAVNSRVGEQEAYGYGYPEHPPVDLAQQQQHQQYAAYGGQMAPNQPMMPMPYHHFGAAQQQQQAYSNLGSQTVFSQQGMPPAPSATGSGSMHQSQARLNAVPEGHFTFKLKTPSGKMHRFTAPVDDIDHVRLASVKKLLSEGVREAQSIVDESGLAYVDDEGDYVHITGSSDLADAVDLAVREGKDRVTLQINPRALVYLDEKDKEPSAAGAQKTVNLGPLGVPEKYLVPTAVGGGFVTALLCVWLAVKLSKN